MRDAQPSEVAPKPVSRLLRRTVFGFLALSVLLALSSKAQSLPGSNRPTFSPPPTAAADDPSSQDEADHEKMLRVLNAERQKSLVADTNKLLRLVKELNAQIASSNPIQLTSDESRKLATIEKLAHSVREKMSTSVRGLPAYQPLSHPMD
jgi:hypothetical protein